MTGKKGTFGYRKGLQAPKLSNKDAWFDVSSFLLKGQEPLDQEEEKPRFFLPKLLIIVGIALFAFRLTHLQIAQGNTNRYLAEGNRVRRHVTVAPRGSIIDRKGVPLVINEAGYSLELVPADLPRLRADRQTVLQTLADMPTLPLEELKQQVDRVGLSSLDPIILKSNLAREQALLYKIKLSHLPGVRVSYSPSRRYDTTMGLAHVLGYTSRMNDQDIDRHPNYHRSAPIGRAGLESSYDSELRGEVGISEIEVNATGQFQRLLGERPPRVGKTLQLSLDRGLQAEMAAALQEAMAKNSAKQAVGIAMQPQTGEILALVSLPSYDNNLFAKGISTDDYQKISSDPDKPLLNRALDGVYPAGSTVKPFVAAAALQEKTITPNTRLDTSIGVIKIGEWEFPDWKIHGVTDVEQAIAESNDIFFYALGGGWDKIPGLGIERLNKYYHLFGFGKDTGVDFATENSGLIPDPAWKKRVKKEAWFIGDTYHVAIGQGDMLATPLQMVRALSSLINGGRLITPHVVKAVETLSQGTKEEKRFPEEKLALDAEVIKTVRDGMWQAVNSETGSARSLKSLPFVSAGKTGTAQFGTEEKTHAWYIGYAPYENPEIAVAVIVEGGGEGNAISVPVAGRVTDYYMKNK